MLHHSDSIGDLIWFTCNESNQSARLYCATTVSGKWYVWILHVLWKLSFVGPTWTHIRTVGTSFAATLSNLCDFNWFGIDSHNTGSASLAPKIDVDSCPTTVKFTAVTAMYSNNSETESNFNHGIGKKSLVKPMWNQLGVMPSVT